MCNFRTFLKTLQVPAFATQNGIFLAYCLLSVSYHAVLLSECNNRIRALQRTLPSSIRCSPIFGTSPETEFSSEYFIEMLLSYIFGPGVDKIRRLIWNRLSAIADGKILMSAPEIVWLRVFLSLHFNVDVCFGAGSAILCRKPVRKKGLFSS